MEINIITCQSDSRVIYATLFGFTSSGYLYSNKHDNRSRLTIRRGYPENLSLIHYPSFVKHPSGFSTLQPWFKQNHFETTATPQGYSNQNHKYSLCGFMNCIARYNAAFQCLRMRSNSWEFYHILPVFLDKLKGFTNKVDGKWQKPLQEERPCRQQACRAFVSAASF